MHGQNWSFCSLIWNHAFNLCWASTEISVRIGCSPVKIYFWLSPDCLWVTPGHTAFTVTVLSSHSRGWTSCWENATTESTSNADEPTRCNNDLLIYKINSTCFGQYFAHHQERETEIFTAYGILLLWWVGRRWAAAWHAPDDGQNIARNMLSWSYRSINHCCI